MKWFEVVLQSGKAFTITADYMMQTQSEDIQLYRTDGCTAELVSVIPKGSFVRIIN